MNKREIRAKSVSEKRTENSIEATERHVGKLEFYNTAETDNTSSMRTFVSSLVHYAGEDGFPTNFHFYITKNSTLKLTDSNKVISLKIPIIPIVWNINSRESIGSFVKKAKNPSEVSALYETMDPAERNAKISSYTDKIMTYITTELALRYVIAKRKGDKLIMKQIKNLKMMEDFDFELFEAIASDPKGLRHKADGHYLVFDNSGADEYVQISDEQSKLYPTYKTALDRYTSIREQFATLNTDIETFRTYDIEAAKSKQTVGGNSLLNKLRGRQVVADKSTKPSQPGDEE